MLGHHRHASETPFKWSFAGGPMMARLQWYMDPRSSHKLKKNNLVKVVPPLTKLSGSAHDNHLFYCTIKLVLFRLCIFSLFNVYIAIMYHVK